ncbi:phage tail protein [uncultured Kordia sp.]|uniref:phage tail protein n=1 Tax=uncultured Kordia sp. TaxID=507699 RepID=UPI00261A7A22|nr:tail fiber protein [uncultured Kordia sp.]
MKQSIQTLKSYFETGDKPTETQFANLIDSLAMPMIGEIKTVSFAAVPSGWAKCDGQLLNIADYGILFGLIGTTYGGDGTTTFALPNLQDRIMIHNSSSLSLGQTGGTSENTLTESQLPGHTHAVGSLVASHTLTGTVLVNEEDGETNDPIAKNFGLIDPDTTNNYNSSSNTALMAADNVQINGNITLSGATASTGSATPVNNMQPYLVVNTIIALEGIDPLAS